jgi:hypothetical protein
LDTLFWSFLDTLTLDTFGHFWTFPFELSKVSKVFPLAKKPPNKTKPQAKLPQSPTTNDNNNIYGQPLQCSSSSKLKTLSIEESRQQPAQQHSRQQE